MHQARCGNALFFINIKSSYAREKGQKREHSFIFLDVVR